MTWQIPTITPRLRAASAICPAFVKTLGDGLLEQYVVARLDGQHAGLEVRVLGCRDQHGIGRPGLPEEEPVVVEAL